jgi:hypothetical protein
MGKLDCHLLGEWEGFEEKDQAARQHKQTN